MNNENKLEGVSDFFYNFSFNFLKKLEEYWNDCGFKPIFVERSNEIPIDTLVINFGTEHNPINLSFTFIPIPSENEIIDSVLLQIYTVLDVKPSIDILNQLEKSILFLNNQLPIGQLGISNGNEVTLRTIQSISTNTYDFDTAPIENIVDLFQMIISIYTSDLADICTGKKTFKQLAYELH